MVKRELKQKAIELRRQGKTYSEILKEVKVAKSTLTMWFLSVSLAKKQKQRITEKRLQGQRKGAAAQKNKRLKKQTYLIEKASDEIGSISERELWLIGTALYWAEGSKQKETNVSTRVQFSNTDPRMIKLFLMWLTECLNIPWEQIDLDLYIHESHKDRVPEVLSKWGSLLNVPQSYFKYVYFKKNKIRTKRKNIGALYIGLLRVSIRASSDLNRSIAGWIQGIATHCGIV